jgi:hypothetical protein
MKSLPLAGSITCIALAMSGCSTLYKLDVTAYNNPNVDIGNSYVILSGNPDLPVSSPEFVEYASQVERALEPKGFTRVAGDDPSKADLGVYVSMAVSDPAKRYHTVQRGLYESPYADESAATVRGSGQSGGSNDGSGGASQAKMPTTPAPEMLSGVAENSFATTVFTKHLNLVAVDLQSYIKEIEAVGREKAVPIEVWSVDIETTGQPSDLKEVFPVMVAAGQPYVGDSTDDVVQTKLSGSDQRVRQIKTGN